MNQIQTHRRVVSRGKHKRRIDDATTCLRMGKCTEIVSRTKRLYCFVVESPRNVRNDECLLHDTLCMSNIERRLRVCAKWLFMKMQANSWQLVKMYSLPQTKYYVRIFYKFIYIYLRPDSQSIDLDRPNRIKNVGMVICHSMFSI